MGFIYEIKPSGGDIHENNPYWFAAFVRFRNRDTFTRERMVSIPEDSSRDGAGPIDELPTLVTIDDITSWSVESGKTSHTSHCSMTLTNGRRNYVAELAPGDWVCFWVFDNRSDFDRVLRAVKNKTRANGWMDGLKFMGRVSSVRGRRTRAMGGQLTVNYSISATGFGEFDSFIYYNSIIKAKYGDSSLRWMMDFGGAANNLILGTSLKRGIITSQDVLPKLIKICLGIGPFSDNNSMPTNQVEVSDDYKGNIPGSLQGSPNRGYLVPATVGRWLLGSESLDTIKDVGLTYVDLLRPYIGIQRFSGTGIFSAKPTTNEPWRGFLPDIKKTEQNTYLMRDDLSGEYRILTLHFDNKSVWSLLQSYVNEPIDEMYTCMRVDHTGHVMPSIVARQVPFSTIWMAVNSKWTVTPFTELPRWKISTDMLVDEESGRSDAMRFNYLHFIGQDMTGSNTEKNGIHNYVRNPPIVDGTDINRSGLRSYIKQLSANVNEGQYNNDTSPGAKWQQIMADILMGSHLKYSGTIISKGIQAPIAEGDNLEFESTLYHIERVAHSGGITLSGTREWTTTLSLSNGISVDVESSDAEIIYPDIDTKPERTATIIERGET